MGTTAKQSGVRSFDSKEFEFPETLFVRDIENRVFQGIVLQCLSTIEGISLLEGNFIDHLFNRSGFEGAKGIHSEQDSKTQSVHIKIEVNVQYGIPIPAKAEEIQTKVAEAITHLTGLHVASIHLLFKNIIPPGGGKEGLCLAVESRSEEEYSEEF